MNETSKVPGDFEEIVSLVRESFPDLRCLRCGNVQFYATKGVNFATVPGGNLANEFVDVITLACTRCGYLEQHLAKPLLAAKKPISFDDGTGK